MYVDVHSHRAEIVKAHKSVLDDNSPINWALFGYAGQSFSLKVVSCGEGGPDEMVEELNHSQVMYAFCRLTEPNSKLSKFVLVNWQGESTPALRKGVCANHMRDVAAVLHSHHVTVTARDEEEAGASSLLSHLARSSSSLSSNCSVSSICTPSDQDEPIAPVCSNYRRVQPAREISVKQRDLFWRQQKLEEEERRQAELQKEAEKRKQREAEIKRTEEEQSRRLEMRQREVHNSIDAARQQVKVSLSLNHASPQQQQQEQEQGQQCRSDLMRAERNKEAKQLITGRICEKRAMFERGGCAPTPPVTSRAGAGSAGDNRIGRVKSMGSIETGRQPDCNGHTEPRHPQGSEVKASVVTEIGARPVNDARPSETDERTVLHRQQNGSRCNGAAADSGDREGGGSGGGSADALPTDSHCQSSSVSASQHSQKKKLASAVAGTENTGEPVNGRDTGHSAAAGAAASTRPDSNGVGVITPREPASPAKPGRPTPHCSPAAQGRQAAAAAAAAAATAAPAAAATPPATAATAAAAVAVESSESAEVAVESSESADAGGDEQWRYGDVQIVTASGCPATVQLTREHGLCAQAMYDYQAADDTEITFDPGDIITNIDRVDVGWWQGLASDGHFGLFPANYVELINA